RNAPHPSLTTRRKRASGMTSKPVKVNRDLRSHRRTVLAGRRQRKGLRVRLGPKKASRKRFRSRSRLRGDDPSISPKPVSGQSTNVIVSVATRAFVRTQLISCRLPKADSALLRSSLFHHLYRFVSFSSGGLASARESLCRGLGSRWFMERFHKNALVTHFQHGQVFCAARQLKDYAVTRCRLHQRAPQR